MKTANHVEKKAILDGLIELFEKNRRWLLFFGTGASCAMDKRFGMPFLQEHLSAELAAETGWEAVKSQLAGGKTLEQSLTGIGLSQTTKDRIVKVTGDFISTVDRSVRDNVLLGEKRWVGEKLLKALVPRLPPRNPRLPVVTSNYDMLIEYACAANRIRWTTGFLGNLIRVWDWKAAEESLHLYRAGREGSRPVVRMTPVRRVELFKVHGSINRFTLNNEQIECDLWTDDVPSDCRRVIAAPGEQKYEEYVGNLDTAALGQQAQDEAVAFAVIGYGFNDPHLHQRILTRVEKQDCPLVVMTLDLADTEIAKIRALGSKVWVLVAPKLPAGGNDEARTHVYMPGASDDYILEGERIWSCDSFADKILGG